MIQNICTYIVSIKVEHSLNIMLCQNNKALIGDWLTVLHHSVLVDDRIMLKHLDSSSYYILLPSVSAKQQPVKSFATNVNLPESVEDFLLHETFALNFILVAKGTTKYTNLTLILHKHQ